MKPFRAGAADSRTIFCGHIDYTGVTAILEFVAYIPDISTERNISKLFFPKLALTKQILAVRKCLY